MGGWMSEPSPQRTSGTPWTRWCEKYSIQILGELWKATLSSEWGDAFMTRSRHWRMCYLTPIHPGERADDQPATGLSVEENNKSVCLWIEFLSLVRQMVTSIGYRDIFAPDGHKFLAWPPTQSNKEEEMNWTSGVAATRPETKQLLTGSRTRNSYTCPVNENDDRHTVIGK